MEISEKTKISLSVAWIGFGGILGFIVTVCFIIAETTERARATDVRVDRVVDKIHRMENLYEDRQQQMLKMLTEVRDRTIRIEVQLGDR